MNKAVQGKDQELATLLSEHAAEILTAWVKRIHHLPDSNYSHLPLTELLASMRRALEAIIEALITGSYAALEAYLTDVSLIRLRMGFHIGEVVEALLLCKEVALPVIWRTYSPDLASVQESLSQLDVCLRWMVGHFANSHAADMMHHLEEQQARTALMLDMARTASSTLELDAVLQRVAEGIAAAVGVQHCGILLVDEEQGRIIPRLEMTIFPTPDADAVQDIRSPHPPRPIEACSAFLRQVVRQKEPLASNDVQTDPRFEPEGAPRRLGFRSVLAAPLVAKGRVVAVAYAVTLDDSRFFTEEQIQLAWGLANSAALAFENARLYEESRQRLAETQSLQRVTSALLKESSLEEVLKIVGNEAQRLTGALGSDVCLLEDSSWLQIAFSTGEGSRLSTERLPVEGSLPGTAVRSGEPILSNDPDNDEWTYYGEATPTALLCIPLVVKGSRIGALCLADKPEGFSETDVRIISMFADQAAIAIENARLHQQVRQLAVLEERERLAREMHDNLAQAMATLNLKVSLAETLLSSVQIEETQACLLELKEVVQETYTDVREAIFGLRTPESLRMGFLPALREYLAEYRTYYGIDVPLVGDADPLLNLPAEVEIQILRIIQEALTNVRRHADTDKAQVRFATDDDHVLISVADNGRGFDLAQLKGESRQSFGLQVMRERAESVGGELELDSQPGKGTRIVIRVPCARER